ncbi:hypothetical protein [Legionella micdadei]|uniref:Uncharacterized protein n=1 Tax=Legionella micdadei TaxID=451 RepID=A0A098GHV4_LEGMI|nr:hypothetical protein [Legionella micdadei]ARG97011.1 hypothetical protein B6N58_04630 [Legionella micdadei]ARH00734.1 hypothetical protein B6V88_10070 [Legionella micdadei]KTD26726.1 hypothetical protein Lmic_2820 [Legionella micdadei]NSL18231.1 hypothetical protein [Legionella micdadei]CEG61575.1 conserved protein of unknown function [Legionella micdadei]
MKKDEHQTTSETQMVAELKSSTALTLQELNKETEKKEAAAEAMRTRCKICFRETSPKRICGGHGGGGGGSGGGSESASEEKASQGMSESPGSKSEKSMDDSVNVAGELDSVVEGRNLDSQLQADAENFDPRIIAELIDRELLVITNDRESMTLSINLQCDLDSLTPVQKNELKKFMEAILKEFNTFKERNHLSDDCVNIVKDEKRNILAIRITLPTVALYDAFMQQLANNLLPTPMQELRAQSQNQHASNLVPTPLPMEPKTSPKEKSVTSSEDKPSEQSQATQNEGTVSKNPEDKEELKPFNPSPFSTEMKPR